MSRGKDPKTILKAVKAVMPTFLENLANDSLVGDVLQITGTRYFQCDVCKKGNNYSYPDSILLSYSVTDVERYMSIQLCADCACKTFTNVPDELVKKALLLVPLFTVTAKDNFQIVLQKVLQERICQKNVI